MENPNLNQTKSTSGDTHYINGNYVNISQTGTSGWSQVQALGNYKSSFSFRLILRLLGFEPN